MVCEPDRDMAETTTRPPLDAPASAYDRTWIADHLAEERQASSLLGEIREVVFGLQDGLVSTLAVVATVAGASGQAFPVVVAGIASGLAGVFSMAAGEYIGSKSQREIFDAQIHEERDEVAERPGEAEAEVAFMLAEEGLPEEEAQRIATMMARHPEVLLRTMVTRELGIQVDDHGGSVLRGALFMGTAFGLGAFVPILPFLLVPIAMALPIAVGRHGSGALRDRRREEPVDPPDGVVVRARGAGPRRVRGDRGLPLRHGPAEPARGRRDRQLGDRRPHRQALNVPVRRAWARTSAASRAARTAFPSGCPLSPTGAARA